MGLTADLEPRQPDQTSLWFSAQGFQEFSTSLRKSSGFEVSAGQILRFSHHLEKLKMIGEFKFWSLLKQFLLNKYVDFLSCLFLLVNNPGVLSRKKTYPLFQTNEAGWDV